MLLAVVVSNVILLAGATGYFVCFWPGNQPVGRILWWICLPACLGLVLTSGVFLHFANAAAHDLNSPPVHFWKLGPGFHFMLSGLVLIGFFTFRLASGLTSLPLGLRESGLGTSDDVASWDRTQRVVWVEVALLGTIGVVAGLLLDGLCYFLIVRFRSLSNFLLLVSGLLPALTDFATCGILVGVAVWILGKEGKRALRRSLRLPLPEFLGLALAFSVGVSAVISLAHYFLDRLYWAAHLFGKSDSPQPGTYFPLPSFGLFLFLLPAALAEEIVFRGLLQPRFISRYGLLRGIFLVSIAWAATHFFVDFHAMDSYGLIFLSFAVRLLKCTGGGFVLSWLTLRTRSVLPAVAAHAADNAYIFSNPAPSWAGAAGAVLWSLLAIMLFRFWPVRIEESPAEGAPAIPESVPAS